MDGVRCELSEEAAGAIAAGGVDSDFVGAGAVAASGLVVSDVDEEASTVAAASVSSSYRFAPTSTVSSLL